MPLELAAAFVRVQMRVDRGTVASAKREVKSAADSMDATAELRVEADTAEVAGAVRAARQGARTIDDLDPEVEVDADTSRLATKLDGAERTVENSAREMGATLARWFTADKVVEQIDGAIDAASALEQSIGGSEAVFGQWSSIVQTAAEGAADSMGLSENAALTLTSQIGGLLQGFGFGQREAASFSIEIAQLGADLSATFGGRPEEAVEALGSALRGEFNPLERFGVSLNQTMINLRAVELGLADSTSQVDLNARAQAALSLVMERTTGAQGQFAREADTAAGKQARLSAEFENARAKLGEQLLPIYSQAVEVASTLVDVFSSLPGPVQAGIVAMLGVAAVAGPVRDVTRAFSGLTGAVGKLNGGGAFGLVGLTAAIGVGIAALDAWGAKQEVAAERTQETADALLAQRDALLELARVTAGADTEIGAMQLVLQGFSEALANSGDDGRKLTDALGALGFQASDAAGIITGLRDDPVAALQYLAREAGVSAERVDILARAVASTDDNGRGLAGAIRGELMDALNLGIGPAQELADQLLPVAQNMEQVQDVAENNNVDEQARQFLNLMTSSSAAGESLVDAAAATTEWDGTAQGALNTMVEFLRLYALEDQATQDAIAGTEEHTDAIAQMGKTIGANAPRAKELGEAVKASGDEAKAAGEEYLVSAGKMQRLGDEASRTLDPIDQMVDATSDLTRELDDASREADSLRSAIDKLLNPADELRETSRAVWEEMGNLSTALQENGADFDVSTAAGRANQEQLEATRDALLAHGVAMVQNGSSAEAAAGDIATNTMELRRQLEAAGLTTDQIDALIREYGLMPDQVTTYLQVAGEQQARDKINAHKDLISRLPTSTQLYLQALIDQGAWNLVNAQLNLLTAPRRVLVSAYGSGLSSGLRGSTRYAAFAEGGVVDRPTLGWPIGEDGTEVVFPLDKPNRIRELWNDSRVGPAMADALGADGGSTVAMPAASGLTVQIGSVGSARDLPEVVDRVDEWWWKFSMGARP